MINYEELKMISVEELNSLIQKAEKEIKERHTAQVEEAKAETVIAIRKLIAVCREAHIDQLGKIWWECDSCDESIYFDILSEDVLADVANVLEGN